MLASSLAALTAAGCSDDKTGDADAFCTELEANAPSIMNPQLATDADVEAHVGLYRSLHEKVPLAIEEEWGVLLDAYETAASIVPGDAEAAEIARRKIYTAEGSGAVVREWVTENCALDLAALGPIGTFAPAVAPTTTTAREG